ncbi:MAG: pseudouridine-5'-phosphate glycosidase [Geminicoccaceae bacterium]|nr:pseudouridine-5'-phosphate glycosidase [Geminicoccaceae bacterium]
MIELSPEIEEAIGSGQEVVALETTLICHGLPRPDNLAAAFEIEQAVRDEGAVPATIGILDGRIKVGLSRDDIERLAGDADVMKCSTRDLALVLARRRPGATTVAATIYIAHRAGIRFMATGGLGGVHRGGESSMDISADIGELARSATVTVCSGAKAILDLPRTVEALESHGVALYGFKTDHLPGFYVARTAISVPGLTSVDDVRDMITAHAAIGWPGSIVIANPPPADLAMHTREFEALLDTALAEAARQRIEGPAITPYLLACIAEGTKGRSVALNRALVVANARLAARIAMAAHTTKAKN